MCHLNLLIHNLYFFTTLNILAKLVEVELFHTLGSILGGGESSVCLVHEHNFGREQILYLIYNIYR